MDTSSSDLQKPSTKNAVQGSYPTKPIGKLLESPHEASDVSWLASIGQAHKRMARDEAYRLQVAAKLS